MFNESKYTKWYFNIINNAKIQERIKPSNTYYESHHIIPNSLGGTEQVLLTAKEHFLVHWLLTKMCITKENHIKMLRAFSMMTLRNKNQKRKHRTSIHYIASRKARSEAMILNNPMHDDKTKARVSKSNSKSYDEKFSLEKSQILRTQHSIRMTGENHPMFGKEHPNKGKTIHSQEFKEKLSKPKQIVTCPHCNKEGGKPVMKRYHFEKCKLAPSENFR